MVSVIAYYEDKEYRDFKHITKISYVGYDKTVEVPEKNLATHLFPIGEPLWLHSNDGIAVICGNGLRCVEIRNE